MPISAAIGCIIFILLDSKTNANSETNVSLDISTSTSNSLIHLTSILFYIFFGFSLLELSKGFYTKTVSYFLFIALCTTITAIEIFLINTKKQGTFNLLKSFLLILNLTLSNQILYPFGIGLPDLGLHVNSMISIVNNGYISNGLYEYFPCHHILVAENVLITNINPKMMYLYLGGFVICLGLLFVFIIGNKFVSLQFGLLSALIYTSLDYLVMYGSHPVHQSFNYFFSILIFTIILYLYNDKSIKFTILYIPVMITMVFTHHFSAMIILVLLLSFFTTEGLLKFFFTDCKLKYLGLSRLFGIVLIGQWIFYSNIFGAFTSFIMVYRNSFLNIGQNIVAPNAYDQVSMYTIFINSLGSCILMISSVIGFFYFFKKPSFFYRAIITSSVALYALLGIGIIFNQVALLPDRIYPFLQLFGLVFFASGGIIWMLNRNVNPQKQELALCLVVVFVGCLSFFSCSSTISGFETSPFVGSEIAYYKLYDTPQEKFVEKWMTKYIDEKSNVIHKMPFTEDNHFDTMNISQKSFLLIDKFYFITGFSKSIGGHMGQYRFIRIHEKEISKLTMYDKYYNNGMVELDYKKYVKD